MNLDLLFAIINFLVFVAVLFYFLRKPATSAMMKRNEKVGEDIRLSQEMKHLADEELKQAQKKLGFLEDDKKNVRRESEQALQAMRLSEEKNLEDELQRIKREAQRRAESEAALVKWKLEKEIERLILKSSLTKLEKNITEETHEKLNREYLQNLNKVEGLR
ncbi:MAG TPA: hypothetical protein VJB34_08265 [Bdellovibrionota bacterium]|nr:hypothetical protein [Bdellovibrionota bacterium]